MRNQFLLDQDTYYFNHGSFGACPKAIFKNYQDWQLELERNPVQFIVNKGPIILNDAKKALAKYINCQAENIVFTPNPSTALNIVIKNIELNKGDEVLTTDHEYGAMDYTWTYYCKKAGANYIKSKISTPIESKESFLKEFWNGLTDKTKIVFISHITSASALIFPVEEICQKARSLGLTIIIDGAHVPGHIPLDIEELNPDVYTGACHKWMLAPKGASFLYVKKELQRQLDPLVISWGYAPDKVENRFTDFHQFQGTNDFSAYLTIPKAIEFITTDDWKKAQQNSKNLILEYYPIFAKALNGKTICPINEDFLGQMFSVPISSENPELLKATLYNQYNIELPITNLENQYFFRVSIQSYNTIQEIEYLLDSIHKIKKETNLIK
ncbi:aminotransferase class V-fold PLP-dependent enzyme [Crocinitomix catalasitica]|uniref:aminotransferase class V-fold PLP-dependent enzyme n=1 Tax=Crocinitomix catalasitica TaxID=184607 RepID=UPI00048726DF|nr:aminotransferase class V-fold PLP-dependent enzyme [Crocinitomix catalasitica]